MPSTAQAPGGLWLWVGPDRPSKLQRIREREAAGPIHVFDRHQVNAASSDFASLLALTRQQPAASPVRLIIVDEAQRLESAFVRTLLQQADVIARTACVVFLVEAELRPHHPLLQAGGAITVTRFPGRERPATNPFAFTEALGTADHVHALIAMRQQRAAGREAVELLGLIAWQLQQWLLVKRVARQGYTDEQVESLSGLRPWRLERLQFEARGRSLESLQRSLTRCWQLDVEAKSGRTVPELALEALVIELCLGSMGSEPRRPEWARGDSAAA